jgi:hypothetical protein
MNVKSLVLGLSCLLAIASGCSSGTRTVRVAVPPQVDLRTYPVVGLVNFSSNARGQLDRMSTQRFLNAVQAAQPGTRVVELGSEEKVLASVDGRRWDRDTIRAVREKHEVDVIIIGRLDVEKAKPDVQFSSFVKRLSVSQDVNAQLSARLVETDSGATVWSDSARCTTNLANGSVNGRGGGHFNASDPDEAYGEMIDGLVYQVTDAFRVHYVTREVPRNSTAVASAE